MNTLRIAAIAGPLTWIFQMGLDWAFAWPSCMNGKTWLLVVLNLLAMSLAAVAALMASRQRAQQPFGAIVISAVDAIFALLIFAQTLPLLLFRGCA